MQRNGDVSMWEDSGGNWVLSTQNGRSVVSGPEADTSHIPKCASWHHEDILKFVHHLAAKMGLVQLVVKVLTDVVCKSHIYIGGGCSWPMLMQQAQFALLYTDSRHTFYTE